MSRTTNRANQTNNERIIYCDTDGFCEEILRSESMQRLAQDTTGRYLYVMTQEDDGSQRMYYTENPNYRKPKRRRRKK
jgi:hypothetical protein